jgi:hypothetical protein
MLAIEHDGERKVVPSAPDYVRKAAPTDLGAAPDAIRDVVAAARQLGYEVVTVAQSSSALAVHMTGPLRPEDRDELIRRFPALERWFYSGSPHDPPDEGFRDAVSGAAISFPAWMSSG